MTGNLKKSLIYVVEDDEEQLALLRMLLFGAGFDVVTETNADKVVEGIKDLKPDVVLLDVMLPSHTDLDGFELCRLIKNDPELSRIKIFIVSAIAQGAKAQVEKMKSQVGADDFILKPYQPTDLLARIRRALSPTA